MSGIKTEVTLYRFDKDFFSVDTTQTQAALQKLEQKYPAFLPLYFKFFAPVRDIAQRQNIPFDEALVQYIRFIKPLYTAVEKKYPNTNRIKRELDDHLRYVKHYFPSFRTPVVLTSVESLNPENPDEIYGTTYYQDTLVMSAIDVFITSENDPELKAEVDKILQEDYDRLGLIDALLDAFRRYQLSHAE